MKMGMGCSCGWKWVAQRWCHCQEAIGLTLRDHWPKSCSCGSRAIECSSQERPVLAALPLLFFSCYVLSDSLQPHGLQHTGLPCPSPTPGACSNSCPLSWWCHSTISSSVIPFFSCFQSFPASGSFLISRLCASSGHSIGVSASASVLPMNIQG